VDSQLLQRAQSEMDHASTGSDDAGHSKSASREWASPAPRQRKLFRVAHLSEEWNAATTDGEIVASGRERCRLHR
jgi:hypothetical protein